MFDLKVIFEQLGALDYTPLLLALLLGGMIGLERELHGRPAGLRTHTLVCLVATSLILASRRLPLLPEHEASLVFDPQRLAAGIVTGIGFLGAAAVVRSGDMVRGVTTGATVWCVAGLGVVIGEGAYGIAIALTVGAMLILVVLDWLPGRLGKVVYRRLKVRANGPDVTELMQRVRAILDEHRMQIQEIAGHVDANAGEHYELSFHIRCRDPLRAPRLLEAVARLEGVSFADWSRERR